MPFKWTGHSFTGHSLRLSTQTVTGSFSLFQAVIGGGVEGEKEGSHLGFLIFAWQDTLRFCIPLTKAFHLPWQTWIQVILSTQLIFNDSLGIYRARKKKSKQKLGDRFAMCTLIHMVKCGLY